MSFSNVPLPPTSASVRLITKADDEQSWTDRRETDARTAILRGLSEYLSQLTYVAEGGREISFKNVFDSWAEPEDEAVYPSAVVRSDAEGKYDDSSLSITVNSKIRVPDGRFVVSPCEYVLDIMIIMWATDPIERSDIFQMVEDAMNPVDYMYGFKLELPFYFNARAQYELMSGTYDDAPDSALQRYRRGSMSVRANVPVVRLVELPGAKPKARIKEVGPDAKLL